MASVTPSIDLWADGVAHGHLEIIDSTNFSGWSHLCVPVSVFARGSGPVVLLLAGNHGDEYEGQLTLLALQRDLDASRISGRVIVVPCLSMAASAAGTRLWPDGTNFNRVFPGDPDGTPAHKLAHYLSTELFPRVDVVVDLHSGGRGMRMAPMSHIHWDDDPDVRRDLVELMLAFTAPIHMVYAGIGGTVERLLPGDAVRQGKRLATTELGGGGLVTRESMQVAQSGLENLLRHLGVLDGAARPATPDSAVLDARHPRCFVTADGPGLYEPFVDVSSPVSAGQVLGRLHDLERLDRVSELVAPVDGVLAATRGLPVVRRGDVVAVVGRVTTAEAIVAGEPWTY